MTQIFLKLEDIPFLSIAHVKMDEYSGVVDVIITHDKHKLPLFLAEMVFIDKREEEWIVQADFFTPDYVYISNRVKRKIRLYLIDVFGPLVDDTISAESINDPLAAFGENIERELAHMSM